MIAIDTNILVRLFAGDDPEAERLVERLMAEPAIFVPATVIVEVEWVLRKTYGKTRSQIAAHVAALLKTRNVRVESADAVELANGWFLDGLDFADALHLALCAEADRFVTFDKKFIRDARRADGAIPVTTP